ncbi:hypothetical protein CcI156_02755 [Frankia sp. CcI156]|nr:MULTISPECIES: hypothetical protein [Frankia]OFB38623.1 hypothetical protein Manayef4_05425 [Frankia sp. CgIM4]OHV57642.1 hypothetical protein CgIS1_00345 [Frankia sp. CgIS1]ONH29291.1 hypothetical protein CcI156_02755 [Frankia sp. CcI156]ORT56701.1 hypothetical protein KBI5_00700 [Frankia sp. KB5]
MRVAPPHAGIVGAAVSPLAHAGGPGASPTHGEAYGDPDDQPASRQPYDPQYPDVATRNGGRHGPMRAAVPMLRTGEDHR